MRIAIDCRPLLENIETGVTVYLKRMLASLSLRKDLELDLFYFASKKANWIHEEFPDVRFISFSNSFFHLKTILGGQKLPKSFFQIKPDLIWIPDRRPFFKTEIPIVMTFHDRAPELCKSSLSFKSKLWHMCFSLKYLESICSAFLLPSESVERSFIESNNLDLRKARMVTYEGPSICEEFEITDTSLSEYYGTTVILASKDPRKRLEWMFRLARKFPDEKFLWIGDVSGDKRFSASKMDLPSNVVSLGQVNDLEKTELILNAKVLLSLSSYEGFDLPLLEAASLSTPALMSDIEVHRELYNGTFVSNFYELEKAYEKGLKHGFEKHRKLRKDLNWDSAVEKALLLFGRVVHDEN